MFSRSAELYDAIYSFKDYAAESARVRDLIGSRGRSGGKALLDVACGTGSHLEHLGRHYEAEGLDRDEGMLAVARRRHAGMVFHHGDMIDFELGRRFDAVTCLFSSIGYARTVDRMSRAVSSMARHLRPGGVLLIEPWFGPGNISGGTPHAVFVDRPDLKIARLNVTIVEDRRTVLDFHYLVASQSGVEHFTERHEMGLFTIDEYREAIEQCGLAVDYDSEGLTRRGLFLGLAPGEG